MAHPNPRLQAAIAQFAGQPGITSEQAAQLRAAVTREDGLLRQLNQAADGGQLQGFALLQDAAAPQPAGAYDKATGMVSLPATGFQAGGMAPSADLVATLRVQEMVVRFAHGSYVDTAHVTRPVTQDMLVNLQSALNGSPLLAAELKRAVTPPGPGQAAPLQHFALLGGTVAGGTYSSATRTINLPPGSLAVPPATFAAADMTFVLGHEIQHAFNAQDAQRARDAAYAQARQIASDRHPVNDYTAVVGAVIQSGREDEAKAQIAGWNALLSREQHANPSANLTEMWSLATRPQDRTVRVLDFVMENPAVSGQAMALPDLSFNLDGSLSMTPANVAQVGKNYFDKPPRDAPGLPAHQTTGLGFHGDSDYPNYYAAHAVSHIIAIERTYARPIRGVVPRMQIDMASLRLREDLMERNGITITRDPGTPHPYYDTSQSPAALHHFDHTHNPEHADEINAHRHIPIAPGAWPGVRGEVNRHDDDAPFSRTGQDVPPSPAIPEQTASRQHNPLVAQYFAALEAGDEHTARTASMAYATSERWQGMQAMAEQRILEQHRQLPGRDNPLFGQAMMQLEKLGPQAGGYLDRVQMEQMAGAIACQAKLHRLPRIDVLTPSGDGQTLLAASTHPNNPSRVDRAVIDMAQATTQPLEQSLRQLTAETLRQQEQALLQSQARSMEATRTGFSR